MTITNDAEVAHVTCVACEQNVEPSQIEGEYEFRVTSWSHSTECGPICNDCYWGAFHCPECDCLGWDDDSVYTEDSGTVCQFCFEGNGGTYCDGCSCYFYHGPCEDCAEASLLPYDYRPRPVFHGSGPVYFGVELEVEAEGHMSPADGRDLVRHHFGEETFYVKHDGSLNNGMEIVSMPMDLGAWRDLKPGLERMYRDLVAGGFRGWRTGTAGLHVHVSAAAFARGGSDLNEAHLWRFLRLYYGNPAAWQRFAGRSNSHWANFDLSGTSVSALVKQKKHRGWAGARYMAWNLTNQNTYEGRMFRSSINADRVIGNIEAIHASIEYTRSLNAKKVHNGALRFDVFANWLMESEQYPLATRLLINSKATGAGDN